MSYIKPTNSHSARRAQPPLAPRAEKRGGIKPYRHHRSGSRRYEDLLKREEYKQSRLGGSYEQITKDEPSETASELSSPKGTLTISLNEEIAAELDQLNVKAENEELKARRNEYNIRRITVFAVCFALSLGLNLFSLHVPLSPSLISIEFSACPELLACLSINPLSAAIIIVLKNILYFIINPSAAASIPNKIILNFIFVLLVWGINRRLLKTERFAVKDDFGERLEDGYSSRSLLLSGFISSAATSFLSVITFTLTILPILKRENDAVDTAVLESYRQAFSALCSRLPAIKSLITELSSLNAALLFYNVPLNLVKYFVCVLIAAFLVTPVRDYINKQL